ncbi:MAG: TolC family protein [Planctomycetota bacterium]
MTPFLSPKNWRNTALLPLVLMACAQPAVELDLEQTEHLVAGASGGEIALNPLAEPLNEESLRASLADGLDLKTALSLTLQNKKELQAELLEVGLAQADLVQAGLLSNPTLDLAIRFPGDGTGNLIDALLGFELLEMWQVPLRERTADYALQTTVAEVARAASGYLRQTRVVYLEWQLQEQLFRIQERKVALALEQWSAQGELAQEGLADSASVEALHLQLLQARNALDATIAHREAAAQAMGRALSLSVSMEGIALLDPWPVPGSWEGARGDLVTQALEARLDLRAMASKVEALEAELALRKRQRFGALSAGPSIEDPGSGETSIGPGVSWTIPLFDRNQAGVAKAEFALQQARLQWEGAQAQAAQDVRSAWSRMVEAGQRRGRLFDEILPLARSMEGRVREAVELGAASWQEMRAAEVETLEVLTQLLRADKDLLEAQMELEWATGGPLPWKD